MGASSGAAVVRTGKPGRPAVAYSVELAAEICTQIASGLSLQKVCQQPGMPSVHTIFMWLSDATKSEFSSNYTRARDMRSDKIFEETLDISDRADDDLLQVEKLDKDGKPTGKVVLGGNHVVVQRHRLMVDTRKWFLSRMDPKRFGDRQQVDHTGGLTLDMIIRESYSAKPDGDGK